MKPTTAMTARIITIALSTFVAFLALVAVAGAHPEGRDSGAPATGDTAAFAWLHPGVVPAGWTTRRLAGSPARLSAPPGWRAAAGDPGTETMVLRAPSGHIIGYLNATPRQGGERAADWPSFRLDHNRDEGLRKDTLLAAAGDLQFRSGTGSCVLDSYTTSTGNRYREIACLVVGRTATTVIVAAAPPSRWAAEAPLLDRAVSDFIT
ncbi:MAG TPA: hypothetical protein VGI17_10450 [Solirubrobacterales bacterium]|jgi:hypothetical protein